MKQRLIIFVGFIFLIALLVGLNAVSYVRKDESPDSEFYPNRSTYNAQATGTRAFFDLLSETGRKTVRWQQKPSELLIESANKPQTFVIIGEVRRDFEEYEIEQILRWVAAGGKLVVIDRAPPAQLISTTANWKVSQVISPAPSFDTDPSDQKQMTLATSAIKPILPTVFTENVIAVQPSLFASSILLESYPADKSTKINGIPTVNNSGYGKGGNDEPPPPPAPKAIPTASPKSEPTVETSGQKNDNTKKDSIVTVKNDPDFTELETPESYDEDDEFENIAQIAPVIHVAGSNKNLLADFPYGEGQIVFLSDPYIVSNAGIGLVDNAQLAINIVASREGTIAFDEYHQGFGTNENRLLAYFAGTPVTAILLQLALLIALILFTQSRRFARPLPAVEPSRLTKLEYVSAMAELQQRTKAFDLAIENIYTDFRRRVSKSFGVDNFLVKRNELAQMIAERAKLNADEIDKLMFKCEEIIRGEPTNKREVLQITSRLREIEEKLGLKRNRKQAFRK